MSKSRALRLAVCALAAAVSCTRNAPSAPSDIEQSGRAASVPTGFVEQQVAANLTSPTAIAALPDGRLFVAQQDGQLKVIKNDALLGTNFIDLVSETDSQYERGLLGVAVDANFATNQYVYIYFTTKPPAASSTHNRLIRVTANGDVANTSTRITLADFPDLPTAWTTKWHMGGAIHFGPDGKLYLAVGDHQSGTNDTSHTPDQRPSQVLTSVFGKILRFNPDGTIPSDNPFYSQTTGLNRAIYQRGLRNPFTFAIKSDGALYINDVGESSWEEVDVATAAGKNFGWPVTEGSFTQATYPSFTEPTYTYSHNSTRCAVVGGAFYNPITTQFPSSYVGKYFFADFCSTNIFYMDPSNGAVTTWATGISFPTDLTVAPGGALYYLARGQRTGTPTAGLGKVFKISYTGSNAPQIAQQPDSITVTTGDPATFTVVANNATSYQWQRFGSSWANISGATSASYTISATVSGDNGARFRCNVTNASGTTTSSEAVLTVTSNQPPTATIIEPSVTTTYEGGQVIGFSATATDPEDGTLPASAFTWQVDFQHDTHAHPFFPPTSGMKSGTFIMPLADQHVAALTWYRIYLVVTDSGGRSTQVIRDIKPATYLSDLTETSATNGYGPMEKDTSNGENAAGDGHTITIDGYQYPKGLGVHAASDVRYNLNGACSGDFVTDLGLDDEKTAGSVIFQVWTDGTKVYDSGVVTAATPRISIAIPLAGVNELKLIVDPNGTTNSDHADWAGARVTGCNFSSGGPRKKVAYYPIWNTTGDDLVVQYPQAPSSVPWSKITHINLAFVGINSSYQCAFIDPSDAAQSGWQTNATNLINYRNSNFPNVKVLMTIGGWTMSHRFSNAMNSTNRAAFATSCVNLMNTIGADGIDIDWEYPTDLGNDNCPTGLSCQSSNDPANLTATLGQFRSTTGFAGKLLTLAVRPNMAGDPGNIPYEYQNFFTGTPRRLDWVSVITYDYHGPWETAVDFTSPYDDDLAAMDYVIKGANGVDDTTDGVGSGNKNRVNLGVPYFGPAWYNVAAPGSSGTGNSGTAIVDPPFEAKASFGKAKANFVNRYPSQCLVQTPTTGNVQNRYVYCSGTVGFCVGAVGAGSSATCATNGGTWTTRDNVWMSYEDSYVVGTKADWVGVNNWGGMMWWTQSDDSDTYELTSTISNKLSSATVDPVLQSAYPNGTPWSIPGTIQAEDFDMVPAGASGEGVTYHDTTAGNNGPSGSNYRAGDVDIQPTGSPEPAGYNIGWAAAGEWLEYTVSVASTGAYDMSLRVAATANTRTMHVEMDGASLGSTFSIPNTGAYQTYQTITQTVNLTAGGHVLKVVFDTGSTNLNWISFAAQSGCTAETDSAFCTRLGKNCDSVTANDNCGNPRTVASCGSCNSPQTCGGGGVTNVCGCTPEADQIFCSNQNKNCGTLSGTDNCGNPRTVTSCGTCTSPETCGGGGTSNVCGQSGASNVYLYFEAEAGSGASTAPMVIVNDTNASNGQCIWSGTAGATGSTVPTNGHVTFTFNAASAGTYKVWGRFLVGPATTSDDSLWSRIDSGTWNQWNNIYPRVGNAGYAWDSEHNSQSGDAVVTRSLSAGSHTLEIAYRENGLKMDRFLVTNDTAFTPGVTAKIGSLTVNDTANAASWSIQSNFAAGTSSTGSHPWTDWPNSYVSAMDSGISAALSGKEWIRVAAASKAYTGGPQASITLNSTSDVYLMIDDRWNSGNKPSWLDSTWVDTTYAITVWESTTKPSLTFSVYKKAGVSGTVTTPQIGASNAYDYFIVVN